MKKLLFLIVCNLMASHAFAQPPKGISSSLNRFQVKQQVEQMAKDLKLTDNQSEQFKKVFKDQVIKHHVAPSTLTDETRSSLKSLLTDQQWLQLDGLMTHYQQAQE